MVKNLPANAGDSGLIPGSGRSPGEGHGNLLQYSCLENSTDIGAYSPWGRRVGQNWVTEHIAQRFRGNTMQPLKRTPGMLRTKYTDRTKCWRACGGHGWVIKWRHGFGKHLVAFFKSNHRPWSFSHLIPRYFPREKKECVHRDLYLLTVYRCFTCGGPKPETTQISINRWSDEETVAYPHNGM